MTSADPTPLLPRAVVVLLAMAGAVIVLGGLLASAWLVAPLFLAMVIVIASSPVASWLRQHRVPSWLATTILILLVYAIIIALVAVLVVSIAQLAALLPTYAGRANSLLTEVLSQLARFGVTTTQVKSILSGLNIGSVIGYVGSLLTTATSIGSNVVFVLSLLFFVSLETSTVDARRIAIAVDRPLIAEAVAGFLRDTRRYLVVNTICGLAVAALDTIALMVLGIPLPWLWGVVAFLTNYIPNIGPFLGIVPPALLALLSGGWQLMVIVIAVYLVINFVVQTVIQPRVVGDTIGLSPIVTFLSFVLWGWILGPIGAILAVPMTLLVKALFVDVDPKAGWAHALLTSEQDLPKKS
ncbi:AI-2E family transporter [Fodinicola feengrottensis]|uniref:AI-2E family transporter n=1 Tax=Fodinicola feengrottensis TaxID=435914 RepID=UPI002441C291|nr:AI-2E family transporter [Fodinicola feengrottensis]